MLSLKRKFIVEDNFWLVSILSCNKKKMRILASKNLEYMIMINHELLIYTSMTHSLSLLKLLELTLYSFDTLSNVRIKAVMLLL